jgi:hypothetical protein
MTTTAQASNPRVGAVANVRNRRGIITAVDEFDSAPEGRFHLVTVEYTDSDGVIEDQLIWEREPGAEVVPPSALPKVSDTAPMFPHEFDAMVRAARWSAMMPYIDPDGSGPIDRLPVSAPFHGAIQVEDFQLVPLLKALRMPRISLLIADDVGLGKTIEAGLILKELLIRRRIRKVLVICPASLQKQWADEMEEKFSLDFDVVDRARSHKLRQEYGLDANPWRMFPRVVTSYYYLKQANVLEEFFSASRRTDDSPHLTWDLLIVDEAHNLTPSPFGEDSDLAKMLQRIAPYFEHRLFLTATPHNGHTRSFSGLLEMLDPVRFSRTSDELSQSEKTRIQDVLVRRLKSEINAATDPPLFAKRDLKEITLTLSNDEILLSEAFSSFRKRVRQVIAANKRERLAGNFAVEILGKRLLSSSASFADSWFRYLEGAASEKMEANEVTAAESSLKQDLADDRETESRVAHAATTVGAWLKPLKSSIAAEVDEISHALTALGFAPSKPALETDPKHDARFDELVKWVDKNLREGNGWHKDERLVIFTEYKTTLDYLKRRLRAKYKDDRSAIRVLYGSMDNSDGEGTFDVIKNDFNDPRSPVRILIATDAASEGLNLQQTARFMLHYDVPWNPARLEQRNGRIDRHGQPRDVTIHHFTSDDDADVKFLSFVVNKVNQMREDLGSVSEVFDAAVQERFIEGRDASQVRASLEQKSERAKGQARVDADNTTRTRDISGSEELEKLKALRDEVDLDADTLRETLNVALGGDRLQPGANGKWSLKTPVPSAWETLIDDRLRLSDTRALPSLVFDPDALLEPVGPRKVFRPKRDTQLMHLGHPLLHRVLTHFARARFAQSRGATNVTRWTVRKGDVPEGADAVVLLSLEELAVNELRETFHHWVQTIQLPIRSGKLLDPAPHRAASKLRANGALANHAGAQELWDDVEEEVRAFIDQRRAALTLSVRSALEADGKIAIKDERERFQSRRAELSTLIQRNTIERLEREIADLDAKLQQGRLFDSENRVADLKASKQAKQEEIERRKRQYEEMRSQLARESERVLEKLLPKRYAMRSDAQVFPLAVEIRVR